MPESEYIKIHSHYFIDDIREKFSIDSLVDKDGYVYLYKIVKGMYDLKQAAMLGRESIIKVLKPFGYSPNAMAPNL